MSKSVPAQPLPCRGIRGLLAGAPLGPRAAIRQGRGPSDDEQREQGDGPDHRHLARERIGAAIGRGRRDGPREGGGRPAAGGSCAVSAASGSIRPKPTRSSRPAPGLCAVRSIRSITCAAVRCGKSAAHQGCQARDEGGREAGAVDGERSLVTVFGVDQTVPPGLLSREMMLRPGAATAHPRAVDRETVRSRRPGRWRRRTARRGRTRPG